MPAVHARKRVPGADAMEGIALAVRLQILGRMLQDGLQDMIWQVTQLRHLTKRTAGCRLGSVRTTTCCWIY
jgi:hypothetical protein